MNCCLVKREKADQDCLEIVPRLVFSSKPPFPPQNYKIISPHSSKYRVTFASSGRACVQVSLSVCVLQCVQENVEKSRKRAVPTHKPQKSTYPQLKKEIERQKVLQKEKPRGRAHSISPRKNQRISSQESEEAALSTSTRTKMQTSTSINDN